VQFAQSEDSFYAEAALYVAVFPHLRKWLSQRAIDALQRFAATPGREGEEESMAVDTMKTAGARFLPQVHP
jgi:hypothetical protein